MVRKVSALIKTPVTPAKKPRKSKQQDKNNKKADKAPKKVQKVIKKADKVKKETKSKQTKQKAPKVEKKTQQTKQKKVQQKKETSAKKGSGKNEDYREIVIGFIGVGTIVKAMVNGLCNPQIGDKRAKRIVLSPRNEANAKELAKKYKQQITIAKTNQEVINKSQWVVIGLLTTQVETILKDLTFRKDQTIVNLAAMPNEKFQASLNAFKTTVRACPLPPIALNVGATIVQPPHKGVQQMFDALGNSVAVKTSHETYSLQGIACLQGSLFMMFQYCYDWMVNKQKIDPATAKKYIMGTFNSVCIDAWDKIDRRGLSFQDLVDEQTPGGLNEVNLKYLDNKKVFKQFQDVLDATYKKMTNKK